MGQRAGRVPVGNFSPAERGPARRYRVRAHDVGPARDVAYSASVRTRYPRAACIPFVSERRRGYPRSQVSLRPGTGRAIGLPALYATVGRHKRARVAFCLPCCHGLGDALSGTVRWPSSSGRTPIQPPVLPVVLSHKYAVKKFNSGSCERVVGFIPAVNGEALSSISRNNWNCSHTDRTALVRSGVHRRP